LESNLVVAPVYSQIALDIALRIARGDLKENTKVYGRSVMASEYGVSPETIRRSMKLLEDMGIVETRQNSGSVILSAEKAKAYVNKFSERNDIRVQLKNLRELLAQQHSLSERISEAAESIIRVNERFPKATPFTNYEVSVPETSPLIGYTLGELQFWQETTATVIALRRGEQIILSPGPYAQIHAGDTIVFVGDVKCFEVVSTFVCG
jgi:K+/H+ antiporter YhaU regulatory subunit KhtT